MSLGKVPQLLWHLHGEIGLSVVACCFEHLYQSKNYECNILSDVRNNNTSSYSEYM
jgi:hypothetical protein